MKLFSTCSNRYHRDQIEKDFFEEIPCTLTVSLNHVLICWKEQEKRQTLTEQTGSPL